MSSQPHFLKDLEVREIQSLDHAMLARSVFTGIRLSSPPCRLALFGSWGSGKTTILKLVFTEIERHMTKKARGIFFRTTWFNAWDHESSANLFHSLVCQLIEEIPDGVRYSRKGSKIVKRVLQGARIHGRRWQADLSLEHPASPSELGEAAVPDAYGVDSLRRDLERFTEMLLVGGGKGRAKRLVVVVDDLDKCLALHALAFLESIKLFFSRQAPIVFVCATDATVLRRVVQSKYGQAEVAFAESYIEKIFEFSYEVPGINAVQISGLVDEIYRRSGLHKRQPDDFVVEDEVALMEEVLSRTGLALNPRRIKRIFNRFIWFLCQEDPLDPDREMGLEPWLTWLLATEYWRELRDFIGRFGDVAFKELGNRVAGHPLFPHSAEACKNAFDALPEQRGLTDFFRCSIVPPDDAHRPEVQAELRAAVMRFAGIDQVVRTLGL